ncbi:MAG: tRNA pseudouridine(38-40) synthase TruA [Ruminococcaceae bacterium]|nr:tRNA pseudouridine(38-40) synthase TruA [Oscillospiraceae bacterium]
MKILLRIKYLGTSFCGWQYQPNARTVQNTLTEAAEKMFGERCNITGCSRTDSGVHANDFCATVELSSMANKIPLDRIPTAFSKHLPSDVAVVAAAAVSDNFHPRYDVKYKEYIYKIHVGSVSDPFLYGRVWHYDRRLCENAVALMNECASALVGKHNFASFMAAGSKIEDTVRDVKYCTVCRDGDIITVKIAADGFLYNMVRIITGTLVLAGAGKLDKDGMKNILAAKNRAAAGLTAPPDGLYLNKVEY